MIPQQTPQLGLTTQQPATPSPAPTGNIENHVGAMGDTSPEALARVRTGLEAGIQAGEITPEEINKMVQVARAVARNPNTYPQMRQFAVEQGLFEPDEMPETYDEGFITTLLVMGRAMEDDVRVGAASGSAEPQPTSIPVQQGQQEQTGMESGGLMGDGRYVLPKDVVLRKGTEFFDKLVSPENKGGK